MRAQPLDYFGHPARVREDGRVIYDLTLYRVKTPKESRAPWDYYQALATIPGDSAFLPANPACAG
jgi:branched-chain amino acid transport system substrate-binding protein